MNKKALGVVFIVFGVIALVGSGIFMYVLVVVNEGIGSLRNADPSLLAEAGADAASIKDFYQQAGQIMLIGWLWAVSILVSSIASIYSGVSRLRERKKK